VACVLAGGFSKLVGNDQLSLALQAAGSSSEGSNPSTPSSPGTTSHRIAKQDRHGLVLTSENPGSDGHEAFLTSRQARRYGLDG
jgi:hypothetical protein